jgi:hypothetical protein
MPPILPSELPSAPAKFSRSCIPAFVLKAGILGVFLFALVVAVGSFALFGCQCMNNQVYRDAGSENKDASTPPVPEKGFVPAESQVIF